ncbi:MAG: fimbrillin family protein [Alistipes sp.]
MKYTYSILFGAALFMTACQDKNDELVQPVSQIQFCFTADHSTRATDTAFELGDKVGISMSDQTDKSQWFYKNMLLINTERDFLSFDPMIYPQQGDVSFLAYYPFAETLDVASPTGFEWSVATDQRDHKSYTNSDLMLAYAGQVANGTNPVLMDFNHTMSMLEINLIPGAGVTAEEILASNVEITVKQINTAATVIAPEGTIQDAKQLADIRMFDKVKIEAGKIVGFKAIIIPQTFIGGNQLLEITALHKTMSFTPQEDVVFQPTKKIVYNINIAK